ALKLVHIALRGHYQKTKDGQDRITLGQNVLNSVPRFLSIVISSMLVYLFPTILAQFDWGSNAPLGDTSWAAVIWIVFLGYCIFLVMVIDRGVLSRHVEPFVTQWLVDGGVLRSSSLN